MPRICNGGAKSDTYQWSTTAEPSVQWTTGYSDIHYLPDPPKGVPDVPLNVDHRYCTPPPMDPRYIDPPVGPKDDFPPHLGRAPSPDDFDELTGARPPIAPPGSIHNPLVIEDDSRARQYRASLQQQQLGPPPGLERHQPPPKQSSRSSSSTRQPANASRSQPSASSASGSSSSPRATRSNARAGPSAPSQEPPVGRARFAKTAANGFTPKTSSPLKKVAYKAYRDQAAAAQPQTLAVPDQWHIPPRKHSTGSVTILSVTSSDSESDY
ncbi:hypothetical protein C2E23DRAFT_943027 [Lenzites betulinus]|nr:hypothetical protein C2E23DRAFT_943027 [Lenzites betulinus]